jgi:hypothetical protein
MRYGVVGNGVLLFNPKLAILYHFKALGQEFTFVTAMLGRCGCNLGT